MRAVILAGGLGTRLLPYTTVLPKPLMPVGNRPVLRIVLEQLARSGVEEVTLAVGYLAELIEAYFGDGRRVGLRIRYLREEEPLGTVGALALLEDFHEDLLVTNGDILTTLDFRAFFEAHRSHGAPASVAITRREVAIDFGVIRSDESGRVTAYEEKPRLSYQVSTGVYAFSPRVLRFIPRGRRFDVPDLMHALVRAGERVHAHSAEHVWLDIGRKQDYEAAEAMLAEHGEAFGGERRPPEGSALEGRPR
ncbi:MAG: NTP transferase domain-containing protein [Planctomycetes bacterium]|nr:NTP transferase domain-containing protein [Planctomycetota bacterium]